MSFSCTTSRSFRAWGLTLVELCPVNIWYYSEGQPNFLHLFTKMGLTFICCWCINDWWGKLNWLTKKSNWNMELATSGNHWYCTYNFLHDCWSFRDWFLFFCFHDRNRKLQTSVFLLCVFHTLLGKSAVCVPGLQSELLLFLFVWLLGQRHSVRH